MKATLRIIATIVVSGGAVAHASDGVRPFELIRQMQDMQDGVTVGDELRREASDEVLGQFVAAVRTGQVDWQDGRNRAALLFYLLTGGEADLVKGALEQLPKGAPDRGLIEQAFQYADASHAGAEAALDALDPRSMSSEVAGAMALAQARSIVGRDQPAAREKLRAARFLAPGGLIEDMSLRQEILLADGMSEMTDIKELVERYFAVFSASVYAPQFLREFERLGERIWKEKASDKQAAMLNAIGVLPEAARIQIGLRLARNALVRGERASALSTIDATCGAPQSVPGRQERCEFYRTLVAGVDKIAPHDLATQPQSPNLETADRLLRHCALRLAEDGNVQDAGAPQGGDASSQRGDEQGPIMQRALAEVRNAELAFEGLR